MDWWIGLPAAFNGIAGLKQTLGRAPISGHSSLQGITLCMDVAVIGPMARQVEDLGLVLSIISGPDPWDPTVIPMPPAEPKAVDIRKLRVAFYTDNGVVPADAETAAVVKATAKALQEASMKVDEKAPPMIGVQIAAPPFREDMVLAVAQHVETTMGACKAPPI